MTFNVLVGNTDDHARNHAAFWNGTSLSLTPAYDIQPQPRRSEAMNQAMAITRDGGATSRLVSCLDAARDFHLTEAEARELIDQQRDAIERDWLDACNLAGITTVERDAAWGRQFLNPYALRGY